MWALKKCDKNCNVEEKYKKAVIFIGKKMCVGNGIRFPLATMIRQILSQYSGASIRQV